MMITTRGVEGTAPRVFHCQNPVYGSMYKSYLQTSISEAITLSVHSRKTVNYRQLSVLYSQIAVTV